MKIRFLSYILSFFVLFSSFSMTVNASDVDNPYWVPFEEGMLNELYMLVNSWGIFLSPDVSLYDLMSTSPTAGIGLRINTDSVLLEMDSRYRLRSDDGVTFPSEFIEGLKNIVKEYPQTKSNDSEYLEYCPVEQNGQIFTPKVYNSQKDYRSNCENHPMQYAYNFSNWGIDISSVTFDTSLYKVFGVKELYSGTSYIIKFYYYNISDSSYKNFSLPVISRTWNLFYNSYTVSQGSSSQTSFETSWSANFPVFSNLNEGIAWANGNQSERINNIYNVNYYLSQKFNQSVDNSVTITQDMLTQNFQEINNNYYNNVNNYVSNYVTENDSNPDTSALQAKIDEMQSSLDQILEELKNSSGGGSGEGGSGEGGSSSGDSSIDYSKDLEEIKTSLSDIYKKLEEFYEKYKNTVDSETEIDLSNIEKSLSDLDKLLTDFSQDNLKALEDMYKRLDDILTELKNVPDQADYSTNFDNIEHILADIQLLLTSDSELYHSSLSYIEELLEENNKQNKNFFDKVLDKFDDIITYLKKIYRVNVVDTIADIVSAITDLFDFASLAQRSSETANLVKTKFPFCMPFDLFATLGVLSAPAVIPHFDLPFNFNIFGTQTENIISIDLTQYEKLATFSRDAFTVLFVVGLILLTLKIFNGGNDDD